MGIFRGVNAVLSLDLARPRRITAKVPDGISEARRLNTPWRSARDLSTDLCTYTHLWSYEY